MGLKEDLVKYSHDALSGKITTCKKHKWACSRFLKDIESFNTDSSYPYFFDEKNPNLFFEWARLFKHRKGVLKGKNIELDILQKFIFGNIYGWYHKDTGYRRFQKLYWQVARKNGKSLTLSLVASFEEFVFCADEVAEIYCAATKREQAKIVYDETCALLRACEHLKEGEHYKIAYGRLERIKNGSYMRALSEEDKKTGDGLNPQCGIIDEYHAHETSEIYDIIDSGMGARTQPLLAIITTSGFDLNNPCYRVEYDLVSRILNPNHPTNIDSYFAMVNELDINDTADTIEIEGREVPPGNVIDDIYNPECWIKSNPILCSNNVGISYIKKKLEEAKEAPEKMRNVKTKHLNIWVNDKATSFINMDKWNACSYKNITKDDFFNLIKEKTDSKCKVGTDLSSKIDLTSITFEFKGFEGEYYIYSMSFMPSDTLSERMATDNMPFDLWESQGWLKTMAGGAIDYRFVLDYIISESNLRGWIIEEVCIDPWGSAFISAELSELGYTVVDIVQGYKTLSAPTKDFRECVYNQKIIHCDSPVLNWAVGNAVCKTDYNLNMILDKSKAKQRIDPIAACINSHVRSIYVNQNTSIYNKRGMRSL